MTGRIHNSYTPEPPINVHTGRERQKHSLFFLSHSFTKTRKKWGGKKWKEKERPGRKRGPWSEEEEIERRRDDGRSIERERWQGESRIVRRRRRSRTAQGRKGESPDWRSGSDRARSETSKELREGGGWTQCAFSRPLHFDSCCVSLGWRREIPRGKPFQDLTIRIVPDLSLFLILKVKNRWKLRRFRKESRGGTHGWGPEIEIFRRRDTQKWEHFFWEISLVFSRFWGRDMEKKNDESWRVPGWNLSLEGGGKEYVLYRERTVVWNVLDKVKVALLDCSFQWKCALPTTY